MSVEIRINCDGQPGGEGSKCLAQALAIYRWHNTATKVRQFHSKRGWHRTRDGRDICPKCWADGAHKGGVSPEWCATCEERKPCGCDGWTPLPGEDLGEEGEWGGPDWSSLPAAEPELAA
ncbi:hypothetical protein [Streptomyces sp. NPDC008137]|uniref:hypothetical protein n=1 Tax=Streptomyces sp. NPDC008137 TaxID=3364813 RepID=UPI0036E7B008